MVEWVKGLGWIVGPFITWFLVRWLPDHPEYGEKILYYLIRWIPFALSWKERKVIEKEIHSYITEEIKSINSESYGYKILPKGIKIEWTLKKKEEVIIKENEIVIRLGSRANPYENFVDALILYLSNSFMPDEKIYINPALYEACRFQVAISMLRKRTEGHYKIFVNKYYKPALEKHKELLEYSDKLESVEKSGLFIPIVLPVFSFYADRWVSQRKAPSSQIQMEIKELLGFIYDIATKKKYEAKTKKEPPLTYQGNYLRVGVVLVARKKHAEKFDYTPHLKAAIGKLRSDDILVDILFVVGSGKNIDLATSVALRLGKEPLCQQINGASKYCFYPEEGRKITGICYAFKGKGR